MNKNFKKIFIFCLLCLFVFTGLVGCSKDGVKVSSANALARKLTNRLTDKVNVSEDFILEEPIIITGDKEIVGEGTITAVLEGSEESYMFIVADGGKLTVGGSVKIDAAGLMGAIQVQDGGSLVVQEEAVVMNASKEAANVLNEGSLEVAGGTLKDAKGHNINNKKETVISGGEIIGSGEKFAGIYNEGTLTQKGGTISKAYNNVSNIKGSTFTFESGTNKESTRDGVFVANGATMKATEKTAVIENASGRGILLHGQADIKLITIQGCGDSLIKVNKTGVLNLGNGILQEGNYHGVDNAGTMNMLGGNIQANKNCGIVNTGTLKVTSGNIANNENKGILNKHEGTADVTSAMVTFTANKTAIANEDKAVFEFAKAKIMMSTQTNIYCYDGTINIHDTALNASTSNNVRIIDGVINMVNVEVKGNSQSSGTSHHGIYMEGGLINAENVTVSMTTGNGIRNKGGVFKGTNIVMHDINRVGISQGKHDYLDVEGLTEINGLEIQSTNYANVVNDGGGTIKITDGKLAIASSNSVRSNGGKMELTNVTIPGHKEGSKDNIHGIYLEGGEIVAKKVTIENVSGNALRNKNGKFVGTNIKMTNIKGQTAISNLPLNDDEKDGIINIDGLTIKNSASKNITLDSGVTTIKNATLGPTGGNNIKMQNNAATLHLYNVEIQGQVKDATASTHGIMVEGGNVFGEKVSIANTNACGIRSKLGKVDLKDVTMTEIGQAAISNSKMGDEGVGNVTIDGLTTSKVGTNNVTSDAGKVIIRNATLCKIESDNHNVKVAGTGFLSLNGVEIQGTTSGSKYGVIVEGGEAAIKNTKIYDLAKSGIHANKETSKVTGESVTIENGKYGITGSNGSISLDNVTTAKITDNNILADNNLKVTLTDSTLGVTTGHNVKATRDAFVSLNGTVIEGVTDGSKHGVMAEGGDFELKDVTIKNVKNTAIRINNITSSVNGKNVTITDSGNGVTGTNGKVVIDGMTTTGITGNNVVADSSAKFTIKNANLCKVTGDAHNVKVAGNGKLKMTDSVINGTTSDSKYGIIAEGGEAELKNIEIYDVAKSGIHANKESSIVIGKNITIANGAFGITGSAGNIVIEKLKTSDITDNNILISGTCDVTVTKSAGGYGLGETDGHSVKVTDDAVVTLETVEIKGVTAGDKHGVMAEGGDVNLTNVNIHDVNGTAIRINKTTSEVNGKDIIIKNSTNGVTGSAGTVVVDGLTTSQIDNNNALSSGADISIKNGDLGNTAGHNIKSETNGILKIEDTTINGITVTNKYGVMAEGGYVNLDHVTIKNVPTRAIYSNTDSSVVEGQDVTILESEYGVYATKGSITIDKLASSATTSNVTISGGTTKITNGELDKTADSNVVLSGGTLTLDDVNVNGTSKNYGILVSGGNLIAEPNVLVKSTAAEGILNQGGTIEGKELTIKDTGATALHNTNGGQVTLTDLTISGVKGGNNIWNEGDASAVTVLGGTLEKSVSNNVNVAGGTVTLKDAVVKGTTGNSDANRHNILAAGGDVVLENVTLQNASTAGIRVNNAASVVTGTNVTIKDSHQGISANAGETTISGLVTSGIAANNITTDGSAKVTINKQNDGKKSVLDVAGGHNAIAYGNSVITLNDVHVKGTSSNDHNAVFAHGGDFVLNNVDIEGAEGTVGGTGIRINNTSSSVTGENVTIAKCRLGISYLGNIDITGLTCNATQTNVEMIAGSVFKIKDATFGKTTASNILISGGTATFEDVEVKGSAEACGIDISGGTLNLNGEVIVKDTALEGVKNHGGTINGSTTKSVTIQNTGSTAIWNIEGSSTTLKNVTISDVKSGHSVKNEGAESTVTIDGGEFAKTPSNNVYAQNGTVTLKNLTVKGSTNNSTHGVLASGGDVVLENVTIDGSKDAGIRVNNANSTVTGTGITIKNSNNGISTNAGETTITGLTTEGITNNNILSSWNNKDNGVVGTGTVTVNKYADGSKSVLGVAGGHNVKAENDGLITLNDVQLLGSSSEKNVIMAEGGDFVLNNVELSGALSGTGIRINNNASLVTGSNVTINGCKYGISYSGNIDITGLTCNATDINVEITGGTFSIKDATFGKTAASNIFVKGGTANLEEVTINGTSANEAYGIEVSGGTLNLKGDVTVNDTKAQGIYNHGGTINGSTANSVTIQNTGNIAIWNVTDSETGKASNTTLKNVTTRDVNSHTVKNEGAESTVTIEGGIFGKTPTNNVYSANGTITLKNLTVDGTTSQHAILAQGGDFVLDNVIIQNSASAGIRVNTASSLVQGSDVTIKNCLNGITTNNGETIINGLSTSGISTKSANNIFAESSGKVTINGYADGTKSVLGIAGGHNVKANTNGLITLNNVVIQGTSSSSHNHVQAEGGDFALNNVEIIGNGTRTGIRSNNANSSIKGTNVTVSNVTEGISNGGDNGAAELEFENLTISNITGTSEFWNQGSLKLAGKIDANIHNDKAITVEAVKALSGDIRVDWTDGKEPAIAIQFANEADLEASRDYISLGPVQGARHELEYADTYATFAVPVLVTGNYSTLQEAVDAIANTGKAGIIRVTENITVDSTVNIPAGSNVTIVNGEGAKTLTRASSLTNANMFEVASGATLTLASTGDNNSPALILDGGSKAEPQVVVEGRYSLIANSGTLNVRSGVHLTNVIGHTTTYGRAYAIMSATNSITAFKGIITNIEGRMKENGCAVVVQSGSKTTFENAIIEGINSNGTSAIYLEGGGQIIAKDSIFRNNSTTLGGAVFSDSGNGSNKITVENCEFTGNSSEGNGGVFLVKCSTANNINISGSKFTSNSANLGGAIYVNPQPNDHSAKVTITDSIFYENEATGNGGAIYVNEKGSATISGTKFEENNVTYNGNDHGGGAIFNNKGTLNIMNPNNSAKAQFTGNNAAKCWGGAIYTTGGTLSITGYTFDGNSAKAGGAILMFTASTLNNSMFKNNNTNVDGGFDGGAIYLSKQTTFTDCCFESNIAKGNGGAIYRNANVKLEFNRTDNGVAIFKNNTAYTYGGGLYTKNGTVVMDGYIFEDNHAKAGGAILMNSDSTVSNTIFKNNDTNVTGGFEGGAIYVYNNSTFENCNFESNNASTNGGAILINADGKTVEFKGTDSNLMKFTTNVGQKGGAIYLHKGTVKVNGYEFANNEPQDIFKNSGTIEGDGKYTTN